MTTSTNAAGSQICPRVAYAAGGHGYLVAWSDRRSRRDRMNLAFQQQR